MKIPIKIRLLFYWQKLFKSKVHKESLIKISKKGRGVKSVIFLLPSEKKQAQIAAHFIKNDDKNSFDYVMQSLMSFLPMCNILRAEQIAMIVHNTGECSIYSGFAPEIYLIYTAFQKSGLDVEIREYN